MPKAFAERICFLDEDGQFLPIEDRNAGGFHETSDSSDSSDDWISENDSQFEEDYIEDDPPPDEENPPPHEENPPPHEENPPPHEELSLKLVGMFR